MYVPSPEAVRTLLRDPDMRFILAGTFLSARSVRELSDRYGIPLATCYRKAKSLQGAGLLRAERTVVRSNGRPVTLLRAFLPNAEISWDLGRVLLTFSPEGRGREMAEVVGLPLVE